MKELHIRGDPAETGRITYDSLRQHVREKGHKVELDVGSFPSGPLFIRVLTSIPYEPLATIELKLIPNSDRLSLKWRTHTAEMDAVFDDLVSELRANCPEVKIVV